MKRFLRAAAALALALALCATAPAASALYGPEKYAYIQSVADLIRQHGLYAEPGDDPLERGLIALLESDPAAFDLLLAYMLDGYDARTRLLAPDEAALQTTGYVGVGITLTLAELEDGVKRVEVTALHPQGSALRAGIAVGDRVVAVDGKPVDDLAFIEVPEILRGGPEGSFVDLTVRRQGADLTFTLERTRLGEAEYAARALENGVWLMRWSGFRTPELLDDFRADLAELQAAGGAGLILDLRGNGGGRIDMAFEIVEALIGPKGVHYITITGRDGETATVEKRVSPGSALAPPRVVILCDGGTASASEIIQVALCDTGRALSVGETTYGKATAQYEIETPEESLILLTAYKITGPTGRVYDQTGLAPVWSVSNTQAPRGKTELRLREQPLAAGNCSDDAEALNRALLELGLMGPAQKAYRLGPDTQAALNNFRQQRGLPRQAGADIGTLRLLNGALAALEGQMRAVDLQMEKAVDLILNPAPSGKAPK